MKPKIVIIRDIKLYDDQLERIKQLGDVIYPKEVPNSSDEWLEQCKGADIICSGKMGLNSDKLYELKNIFITVPFVGVEFLEKDKMLENNISVSISPGGNTEVVTEWIIGLLLMYFRRLPQLVRTTNINRSEVLETATSLYNKNISILGVGRIGKNLGKVCENFGMKVNFFKRGDNLIEIVKNADIIANCLSSNPSSENLLDSSFFNSLKKGSFFISSSNSKTYDIKALKNALDNNILIGAADDAGGTQVGDINEKDYQSLLNHPKILVTPHIAWNSDAEQRKSCDMMIDNIEAWLNKNPINLF